jgi:hypothetical protein
VNRALRFTLLGLSRPKQPPSFNPSQALGSRARMDQARELRCTECGAVSRDGRGWRAYFVGVGDEVDPDEEVVTYCPACAEREFGPR